MRHWIRISLIAFFLLSITPFVVSANVFVIASSFASGLMTIATELPNLYDSLKNLKDEYERDRFYGNIKDLSAKLYQLERLRDEYRKTSHNGGDIEPIQKKFVQTLKQVEKSFNDLGAQIAQTSDDQEEVIRVGFHYKGTADTRSAHNAYGTAPSFASDEEQELENEKCTQALHEARRTVNELLKKLQ